MSEQAILVASFGTTHDEARVAAIDTLEREVAAAYPGYTVARAFTSGMVIRALAKRGIHVPTIRAALEHLRHEDVRDLIVQPTHLIPGIEFEKLRDKVFACKDWFRQVVVGTPLLSSPAELEWLAAWLDQAYPRQKGHTVVLMGHGSEHFSGLVYPALAYMLQDMGRADLLLGAVEGYPAVDSILRQMKTAGYKHVTLAPLMLVAGDHARKDMAGDEPDSWKSRFEAMGIAVASNLKGLGEYPDIRTHYLVHLAETMEELG